MGFFRLILAYLVVAAHATWSPFGLMPGISAVVGFFILSGFVTTALIKRYYASYGKIHQFYLDRVLRIFPQFLVYLGATTILMLCGAIPRDPMIAGCDFYAIGLNALGLPLAAYMYLTPECLVIPPSWSLGLELSFYTLFPFILLLGLRTAAHYASMAIFSLAFFGVIDSALFGYRILPGTLFMFLAGSFIYTFDMRSARTLWVSWVAALAALCFTFVRPEFNLPHNRSVLMGFVLSLPVVFFLRNRTGGSLDKLAGNLSYGVFLNHYMLLWIIPTITPLLNGVIVMVAGTVLSALTFRFVESPVMSLRHRLRMRSALASQARQFGGFPQQSN